MKYFSRNTKMIMDLWMLMKIYNELVGEIQKQHFPSTSSPYSFPSPGGTAVNSWSISFQSFLYIHRHFIHELGHCNIPYSLKVPQRFFYFSTYKITSFFSSPHCNPKDTCATIYLTISAGSSILVLQVLFLEQL